MRQAIAAYREALSLCPVFPEAQHNLGNCLLRSGCVPEALAAYRAALQTAPGFAAARSHLLLALHYDPKQDRRQMIAEHYRWGALHQPSFRYSAYVNKPVAGRMLRVGYLSPGFCAHPHFFLVTPLLEYHDRARFDVFCYSNVPSPDRYTRAFHRKADHWRDVSRMTDAAAAELIRSDGIDILVDLDGHAGGNRLGIFAMQPAPVQISLPGHPSTIGLPQIRYRFTDGYADPEDTADAEYVESLIRLPHTYMCYRPLPRSPRVAQAPVLANGFVTFGCFGNRPKYSEALLRLWASVLQRLPGSRILFHHTFNGLPAVSPDFRRPILGIMREEGVSHNRIGFVGGLPFREHLQLFGSVDLLLDTFPYNGMTTTLEAAWMGVPTVSQVGEAHVSRTGLSILSNLGMQDWVARTANGYAELAVSKARDPQNLIGIRRRLRERMKCSPLMDAASHAREIERAYRRIWKTWCTRARPESRNLP